MEKKRLYRCAYCNRVALVHVDFIGLEDDAEGAIDFDVCDKSFKFKFWFYDKPVVHSWRKGILITPIWEDEEEYKNALVKEMLERD